jgi:hypothetical protein
MSPVPVAVITNGSLLHMKAVRDGLLQADVVLPSLDAVSLRTFEKINRPHERLNVRKVIKGMVEFRKVYRGQIWLEILFCKGVNAISPAYTPGFAPSASTPRTKLCEMDGDKDTSFTDSPFVIMAFPSTFFIILFILQSVSSYSQPSIGRIFGPREAIGLFEKLELALSINAEYSNPFDPDEVDITASFKSPSGKEWRVPGFYSQSLRGGFFVRFSPNETGEWNYVISVMARDGANAESPATLFPVHIVKNIIIHPVFGDIIPKSFVEILLKIYLPTDDTDTASNTITYFSSNTNADTNASTGIYTCRYKF